MDDKISFGIRHEKTSMYENDMCGNKENVNQDYRPIPRPRTSLINQIQKVSTGPSEINGKSKAKEEISKSAVPGNIEQESTVCTLQNHYEQIRVIGTKENSLISNSSMPTTSQLKLKEKEVGTQSDNTKKLPTSENSISQRISDYNKSCTSAQITPSVASSHDTIEKAKIKFEQTHKELQRLSHTVTECEESLTSRKIEEVSLKTILDSND